MAAAGPAAAWYLARAPLVGAAKAGECTRLCGADVAALEAAHAALGAPPRSAPAGEPPGAAAPAGVVIRSGLWEGDAASLRWASPCYASDAAPPAAGAAPSAAAPSGPLLLVRATWFVDGGKGELLPVGEPLAALLESAYSASGAPSGRVQLGGPGLPSGLQAVFTPDGEAWLVPDGLAAKLSAAVAGFSDRSGGGASASLAALPPAPGAARLRRGFSEALAAPLAEDEAADARTAAAGAVTHLVLTTHGVGHALSFVDAASNAASLRDAMRKLPSVLAAADKAPGSPGRLLLLPVQWRKGLALAGDEGALDDLLPDTATLRPLRAVLNALVSDVLRYMTPDGQKMADALSAALNETYGRFIARHPGFNGPVSVVAHSLGSVLMFDLLSGGTVSGSPGAVQEVAAVPPPLAARGDAAALAAENAALRAALAASAAALAAATAAAAAPAAHVPFPRAPLAFPVDTLLLLGSPLGLFLALRGGLGLAGGSHSREGLACRRLLNVMHPYDPIAYRLEPLAWPAGAPPRPAPPPRPAEVPYCRGGRRIQAELSDHAEKLGSTLRGVGSMSLGGALKGRLAAAMASAASAAGVAAASVAVPEAVGGAASADAAIAAAEAAAAAVLARLAGGEAPARLDYQLQCGDLNPFLRRALIRL
jgi:hypothetical protein